jgi:hypothetical protein
LDIDDYWWGITTVDRHWSGGIPMLRWDLGIHPSDGLFQMRLMTDQVEATIGLCHGGNVVRGVVEFFFSLTISMIEDSRGLTCVEFTEVPWLSMVHDRGF